MKRNLKFWTQYTWEGVGVNFVLTAVLAVISVFSAEGVDFSLFASVVPYFLCIAGIFCIMVVNFSSHMLYVPLLLSMGETRRNVLLGFHYYRALIIAVMTALCALIWLLIPGDVSSTGLRSIPTILCVMIAASAIGSIMGTVFVKWKWMGTILLIVLCGGAGGMVGMSSVSAMDGVAITKTLELVAHLETLPWWLVAVMFIALAADIVFQWLLLQRQEVKL